MLFPNLCTWIVFSLDVYGRIIGMFELNNLWVTLYFWISELSSLRFTHKGFLLMHWLWYRSSFNFLTFMHRKILCAVPVVSHHDEVEGQWTIPNFRLLFILSWLTSEGCGRKGRALFFNWKFPFLLFFVFCFRDLVVASPVEDYFLYIDDLPPAAKVVFSFHPSFLLSLDFSFVSQVQILAAVSQV